MTRRNEALFYYESMGALACTKDLKYHCQTKNIDIVFLKLYYDN